MIEKGKKRSLEQYKKYKRCQSWVQDTVREQNDGKAQANIAFSVISLDMLCSDLRYLACTCGDCKRMEQFAKEPLGRPIKSTCSAVLM